MQPQKKIPQPKRVRKPPSEGWSWIDRRFVREKAASLQRESVYLYFFLASVSDKDGLSWWSDPSIAACLRITEDAVRHSREELEHQDLIAFQPPYYQVLSFPKAPVRNASEPTLLVDIFRQIAQRVATEDCPPGKKGSP